MNSTEHPPFVFGLPERDESPVEIIPSRALLLLRHGEQLPRHAAAGEAVTVPRWILGMLCPGDWQRA